MGNLNESLENHYLKEELYESIIIGLQKQNIDLDKVRRSDISGVDEFHVRGKEVSKKLADSIDLRGASVLDVGCGLGGPCRMLADEYNCQTTGIDISLEYIETAKKLSQLVNLNYKSSFIQGDATELPFENNTFDVVWTQHVQMNIADKRKFYSEMNRVLKKGGYFLFYDVFKNGDKEIAYPMPWADHLKQSFLFAAKEMDCVLNEIGLAEKQSVNHTTSAIDMLASLGSKQKSSRPSRIGLDLLMGETTTLKLVNLLHHLKKGDLELISGVYKKSN